MKTLKLALVAVLIMAGGAMFAQTTTRTIKTNGITMVETLNEDGTGMIQRPYRWFAGMAEADIESLAVEMAQSEAYAAISKVIENAVLAVSERGAIAVNGKVQKAVKSYWAQVSESIQHASEPFGEAESTYNEEKGMYYVTAKVGIRGDRYVRLLDGPANFKPEGLQGSELQQFIDANNAIMEAAKGN